MSSSGERAGSSAVVDVHAHLIPNDQQLLENIAGVRVSDAGALELDGHTVGLENLFRPERLIAWMDSQSVDLALISVPPPAYRQHLNAVESENWVSYLNDGLDKIANQYPERFLVLAHLPLEHPELALTEAKRRQGKTYAGYSVAAGGHKKVDYNSPALRPLWKMLHDASAFVFLHPGHCCDDRLEKYYGENLLGNPYETALAVSHLVFGGIAEEFSSIDFCLAHCGGVVASVAGRWQRGFDTERPGVAQTTEAPAKSLKRFYVDSVAHDNGLIDLAGQVFGKEHILFGSDWPFPMGILDIREQLGDMEDTTKEDILWRNYQSLKNKR